MLSVNYTDSGTRLLECLIHALVSGVTVENVGNQSVRVTSVNLYYGGSHGSLQKSQNVQVSVDPGATVDIDVKMAPTEVSSQGGAYWVLTVVTSDGAIASSSALPLCGDPLPPM